VAYSFVGTLVFGIFIYYATRPIYRRLRRVIRPASLAAAVSLFTLTLPALLLVAYALSVALNELLRYTNSDVFEVARLNLAGRMPLGRIADPASLLALDFDQYLTAGALRSLLSSVGSAIDTVAFLGVGAVHLFVMFALAFYLLRDGDRLSRWTLARFGDDRGMLETFGRAVDRDFDAIFFGNILNAVLTGTIGVLVYSILNVYAPPSVRIPAAALLGLLAGVASLIPVVGMKLVYVPMALYLAAIGAVTDPSSLWFVAVFAGVSLVVVDTIPDLVIRPYVSGRSLHVGSLMIAYTLGPLLFGWYGIFLAPIVLVLVVHFTRLVMPELVSAESIRPYAVDPGTTRVAESEATADADADDAPPAE
jgi:predicted PurR-regulated permease PerM